MSFYHFVGGQAVENPVGIIYRGEEIKDNAQRKGDCKAFDRAGPKQKQGQGGNQGCYVGIDNSQKSFAETAVNTGFDRFSQSKFFPHPFKNKHVRIHSHTDGKDYTGNAGHGESGAEDGKAGKKEQNIKNHGRIGDDPRKAIIDKHKSDNENQRQAYRRRFPSGWNPVPGLPQPSCSG